MSNRSDSVNFRLDGNLGFHGGCDASVSPSDLARNQVERAMNTTFRYGRAKPRPGWRNRALTIPSEIHSAFTVARFQHASFYDNDGKSPQLISSQGGRLFSIDLHTFVVREITPTKPLTTTTTAGFTIPNVGNPGVAVAVTSTAGMYDQLSSIRIGGYALVIDTIDSATQITVTNGLASQNGTVVANPATVEFSTYDVNSPKQQLGWSAVAENYWVYQDNQSLPIIYNGSSSRRSIPGRKEVPVGNVMAYAMGRLIVALPDRMSFRVGDLVFGASGSAAFGYRDSVLRFTENDYLNEGGDFVARVFGAPSNSGPILAMKAFAMTETQLGQGPLLVGTPYVVFTVSLPYDRTIWKNLSNALQTASPIIGPLGQDSTVLINTDVWYRGMDGIRSWILGQREFSGYGNTPQSAEIGDVLDLDTDYWLEHGSAVLFDNRLMMTISPAPSDYGVYHRGLAVLDFSTISTINKRLPPAWEGVWTGKRILKIVKAMVDQEERCFIYALNSDNHIELWEMVLTDKFDNVDESITWSFDTPSYNCGSSDNFKRLETARIILNAMEGTVTGTVQYRSDQNPCWQDWDTFNLCAAKQDCGPPDCAGPHTYREQQRTPIRLKMPPDEFDTINGRKWRTGFEFQVHLEISGYAEVRQLRIFAIDAPEILGQDIRSPT